MSEYDAKIIIVENVNYWTGNKRNRVNNVNQQGTFIVRLISQDQPMATSLSLPAGGTIESASALFTTRPSNATKVTSIYGHRANAQNDKQQRAMAQRLEQLHAALGESDAAPTGAALAARPAAGPAANVAGIGALFLTGIISTLFGASVMWLATQHDPLSTNPPVARQSAALAASTVATAPPASAQPSLPAISDVTSIENLLEGWRKAWEQRNTADYLKTYSRQFQPADSGSREAWVSARTKKLSSGAPIDLQIRHLAIERIDAGQFKATFLQDYASGSYRETARAKTLLIAREDGEWRILQERAD